MEIGNGKDRERDYEAEGHDGQIISAPLYTKFYGIISNY